MTAEKDLELTNQALAIALGEICSIKQEIANLKVKNDVFRSILLGVYRCYLVKGPVSERLFEEHIAKIYDLMFGLAENRPDLKTIADDVREFLPVNDPPRAPKFEVIQGTGGRG